MWRVLFLLVLLAGTSALYGAADIPQAVQNYASFYKRNSTGTLESFRVCFLPGERSNIIALPSAQEKTAAGDAVIVSTNKYGNICEVKYHTGDPSVIEQLVLKQENGEWFASLLYTSVLRRKLQEECSGKLQALARALQVFSQLNGGRYPAGNDQAGWEELRQQKLINATGDYTCPQCNVAYSYIGGKSVVSNANSPLAWCSKHVENGNLSNVLLVSGKIASMPSPAMYVPTAPAAEQSSTPAVQTATAAKTPADWVKGLDESWYVHYEDALAAAKRENKKILLLHTGSDWCGWCKRLARDVLSKDEFKKFARSNFILLYFDSPSNRHPMGQDQRNHVAQTEQTLGISGGYPCTFILDTDEKIVGRIGGYRNLDGYIDAIRKYADEKREAPAAVQAPAAPGWISAGDRKPLTRQNKQVSSSDRNATDSKPAAPKHWLKGPTPDWYIHLDDAVAAAQRTGRKIYALHTGSDWCPPCKRLEKNILSTNKFKEFAQNNIILLFVDSPRSKPIPSDQRAYNRKLAAELNFGGGVPSILLLNSDGKPVDRIGGRRNVEDHINAVKQALAKHK